MHKRSCRGSAAMDKRDGFTLIELLVVLAILAMLVTLSVPRYLASIDTSKETILMENLRTTRNAIDRFRADQGRSPDKLEELVEKRYLRSLPVDPITESTDTWTLIAPQTEGDPGKVYDIRSTAQGNTRSGKAFSEL